MNQKHASRDQSAHIEIYLFIFAALAVLTAATVYVSYLHLPKALGIPLGLAIATLKAGLVATYFMHLKWERMLIYGLLGLTLASTVVLFALPMLDTIGNVDRVSVAPMAELTQLETPAHP